MQTSEINNTQRAVTIVAAYSSLRPRARVCGIANGIAAVLAEVGELGRESYSGL